MALDGGRMVAKRIGDDRHRTELGELVERPESCGTDAEDGPEWLSQASVAAPRLCADKVHYVK